MLCEAENGVVSVRSEASAKISNGSMKALRRLGATTQLLQCKSNNANIKLSTSESIPQLPRINLRYNHNHSNYVIDSDLAYRVDSWWKNMLNIIAEEAANNTKDSVVNEYSPTTSETTLMHHKIHLLPTHLMQPTPCPYLYTTCASPQSSEASPDPDPSRAFLCLRIPLAAFSLPEHGHTWWVWSPPLQARKPLDIVCVGH